ncbi:MAG: capsule assembly Wzi family protein [Prevotellaceae bacterium]|nr:capsule assembly Wzi family protein [Prevotellaceae bacterium]
MRKTLALTFLCLATLGAKAQISRLGEDLEYSASAQMSAGSGDYAPFWFTSNRYGLGPLESKSGLFRASISRSTSADSLRSWRFGYGADFVGAINHDSKAIVQQLYADFRFKAIQLSIGQKERPLELKNQQLSSGGMTTGINARPIPQVRLELPDFWTIPRTGKWLAIKGHIAYGMFTDNQWQETHSGANGRYAKNVLYHSKAGFLRIGNREKFPVTLTGGFDTGDQFGGEAWNVIRRDDDESSFDNTHVKLSHSLKSFWNAFIMGGVGVADGDYKNTEGNQLGSWHLRADYDGKLFGASFYAEHYFDDHSQLFLQYAWKDMLYGGEVRLPRNHFVSTLLYEHLRTTDQSGSIYHDATPTLPYQLSEEDNYYNHGTYTGWHHAGYAMGNPLLLSPVYNNGEEIFFRNNRVLASHFGLSGEPTSYISYRILFTHEKSLGSYSKPLLNPAYGNYLLIEATYAPTQVQGLTVTLDYGQNGGTLLGRGKGFMLTASYTGWINHKRKEQR